jgi:hypothetical protein
LEYRVAVPAGQAKAHPPSIPTMVDLDNRLVSRLDESQTIQIGELFPQIRYAQFFSNIRQEADAFAHRIGRLD